MAVFACATLGVTSAAFPVTASVRAGCAAERSLNGLISFVAAPPYLPVALGQGKCLSYDLGRVFRILYSWVHRVL